LSRKTPRTDPSFRRGVLCDPASIPDPQFQQLLHEHIGAGPACVLSVSPAFYGLLNEKSQPAVLRLAVCGDAGRPGSLVLLLQLSGHQLRCVFALGRPMVQRMLTLARQRGDIRLVVSNAERRRYSGYACEVMTEDLDAVLRMTVPELAPDERERELLFAATLCSRPEQPGSVVPGEPLLAIEVVIVDVAGTP